MPPLKVVYFGTPDFAVEGLRCLLASNHKVVGVVTSPDRPSGRGQKLVASAVKKAAQEANLPIFQPTNLKNVNFQNNLNLLRADIFVVVAFRMLPKAVWAMPSKGTFNLHASLLPDYRGAAPINWAIINGETHTGVTTFFLDGKIDTGSIILQEEIAIKPDDTAGTLHDKLMVLGGRLITKTVNLIASDQATPSPQKESNKLAPKIFRETCQIDWYKPLDDIYNFIRGLSPYPAAWTTLENEEDTLTAKIYKATPIRKPHDKGIGQISIEDRKILVAVKNGYLSLDRLQLPGKNPLTATDLLNGYKIHPNCKILPT